MWTIFVANHKFGPFFVCPIHSREAWAFCVSIQRPNDGYDLDSYGQNPRIWGFGETTSSYKSGARTCLSRGPRAKAGPSKGNLWIRNERGACVCLRAFSEWADSTSMCFLRVNVTSRMPFVEQIVEEV